MRKSPGLRATAAAAVATAVALTLGACSSSGDDDATADDGGKVTITVGDRPSTEQAAARKLFEDKVAAFNEANPDIEVVATDTVWDAQTFQASVAGGTLPTVYKVPFTEIQSLIRREQVANITDELEALGFAEDLNPQSAEIAQDADGDYWGIPVRPYAIGLFYNRALFEQAGLDPDSPPTTWDQVREYAKAISDATGQAGYAQMTTENTGGWMLTSQIYSLGGSIENDEGTAATFDDAAGEQALTYLQQMRWEDGSMGSNFLYNMTDIAKDFAAGKIGMFLSVPSAAYGAAVNNYGMDPQHIGLTAVPSGAGSDGGVLAGGSVEIFSPTATSEEITAALKWVHFFDLQKFTDEEVAKADAEATAADGGAVGLPGIAPVAPEQYATYREWIAEDVNVPLENMTGYSDGLDELELKPEPPNNTQEIYGILDTVVQKVLTEQGVDVAAALADAAATADTKLARSGR